MPSAQAKRIVDAILNNDNILAKDEIESALDEFRDSVYQELKIDAAQKFFSQDEEDDVVDDEEDFGYSDDDYDEESDTNEF